MKLIEAAAWRDSSKQLSSINSAVFAFLWSLDLMERFGQGAVICGTESFGRAVLSREEAFESTPSWTWTASSPTAYSYSLTSPST